MNNNKQYPERFIESIRCPNCGSGAKQGFQFNDLHCTQCGTNHFSLGDVPCLFPAGTHHKIIWQHQTATMQYMAQQGLAALHESLSRYDLTSTTRQRLAQIQSASQVNLNTILSLLQKHGIDPIPDEQLNQMNPGDLSEYFDLLLRDWAWDSTSNANPENTAALQRTLAEIQKLPNKPRRILVLGAGAGRLSWDLHVHLKPEYTVALDSNPLVLAAANELVHQRQSIAIGEFKNFPQIGFQHAQNWLLEPPLDVDNLRATWFPLGANVWQLPFERDSFDLIVTPWFIDVNGGDVRDLIGVVYEKLIPGGHWLNSGPLLFTRHLPVQLKYSAAEIKELISLSGFALVNETIANTDYLRSPLEARFRQEQVWTFSATKPQSPMTIPAVDGALEPWLIMHHQPIPQGSYASQDSHPLIDAILLLVDGSRSINDICYEIGPHLPQDVPVKDVVVTLFGQILSEQSNGV
ncbi:MAG: hypothetical protein Q7T48_20625 [Cellvibrio sp.]|uniref:hypothetical protein n=1 Tax=Cellvibrio sp. TaxID=1965322 RepID=UPI00271A512D|nr:hypothetical protein [Cellvibrio sp.]